MVKKNKKDISDNFFWFVTFLETISTSDFNKINNNGKKRTMVKKITLTKQSYLFLCSKLQIYLSNWRYS